MLKVAAFGSNEFSLAPYQLGAHNEEAVASGAWWFYAKLGFAPRAAEARQLYQRELVKMKKSTAYRSSAAILRRLAKYPLYLAL